MGKLLQISDNIKRIGSRPTKYGRLEYAFEVPCIKCNEIRIIKRRQHAIGMSKKPCKKCSNKNNNPQGIYKGIRISFFNKFKIAAENRSKTWNISIDDAAKIAEKQNWKCALSGINLIFSGDFNKITASLDRINNLTGYEVNNIQWVHKKINMMRGELNVENFIFFCKEVSMYNSLKY